MVIIIDNIRHSVTLYTDISSLYTYDEIILNP